jgi:hypothetical protein
MKRMVKYSFLFSCIAVFIFGLYFMTREITIAKEGGVINIYAPISKKKIASGTTLETQKLAHSYVNSHLYSIEPWYTEYYFLRDLQRNITHVFTKDEKILEVTGSYTIESVDYGWGEINLLKREDGKTFELGHGHEITSKWRPSITNLCLPNL